MSDLDPLFQRILEAQSACGIDMRESGAERWRGDCPLCRAGDDRLILESRLDGTGAHFRCFGRCQPQDILDVWGLSWSDLRLDAGADRELVRRSFDTIEPAPVRLLDRDRIAVGGTTMVVGDPFLGKSTYLAMIAAGVTRGDYGDVPAVVGLVNAEDSAQAVTRPRLEAAGAALERVVALSVNAGDYERPLALPEDVPLIEAFVAETQAALLILDPLMAFLAESVDSNRDHGIRRALAGLTMVAERHDLAVLIAAHLNKAEEARMIYRVGGSIGLVGLARSVLLFARDPADDDGAHGNSRLLAHAASNWARLAPTLRYRIEEVSWEQDGETIVTTKLAADGESDLEADDLVGRRHQPSKAEQAEDAILEALSAGDRPSSDVKAEVERKTGCGIATIERAAARLRMDGIVGRQGAGPATRWNLITKPHQPPLGNDEEVVQAQEEQLPHHLGDRVDGVADGDSNDPLSDRERAIEAIRRYQERA